MWLLLLGVWKCGQVNRPQWQRGVVDRIPVHSRSYPQLSPVFKSVSGSKARNWGCFPRFHSDPQSEGGKIDRVVHSNPQCGERADECGHPQQLCTGAERRKSAHKLSRVGYPLFHGLSTGMWIVFTPLFEAGGAPRSDIISAPDGHTFLVYSLRHRAD